MGSKKKKKRYKVNKKKFISRLFVIIVIFFIIIGVKNVKNDENENISVIIDNKNVTDSLKNPPYINKNNVLYLSLKDIRQIFDKDIYYEESSKKIITTNTTKTSAIDLNSNTVELGSSTMTLSAQILTLNNDYYIPISETTYLYNLEAITGENYAIISSLDKELINIKTVKKAKLKEKANNFSHTIKKIEENEQLTWIESVNNNEWTRVLTNDGKIRIYKN